MDLVVIQNKIHEIRGQRVMIDRDLAEMYQVPTRILNQAVKRNIERFPEDFMFQLTNEEVAELLRSQIVTLNGKPARGQHFKYLPYAFTEQGVAMLSGLLNSQVAISVNISIMRAFVEMRKFLTLTTNLSTEMAEIKAKIKLLEHNVEENLEAVNDLSEDVRKDIDNIYLAIAELSVKPAKQTIKRPVGYKISENE